MFSQTHCQRDVQRTSLSLLVAWFGGIELSVLGHGGNGNIGFGSVDRLIDKIFVVIGGMPRWKDGRRLLLGFDDST